MSFIKSVAFIGIEETNILFVANSIAKHSRILLFDKDASKLAEIHNEIIVKNPAANIEKMNCATDACWEADIIILSSTSCLDCLIIEKIKQVSTGKIVIVLNDEISCKLPLIDFFSLYQLLPHVKLVQVSCYMNFTKTNIENMLTIIGNDDAALKSVDLLFTSAGFTINQSLIQIP